MTAAGGGTPAAASPAGGGTPAAAPAGRAARLALAGLERSRRFTGPVAGVAAAVILVLLLQGNGFASTLVVDMLVYAVAAMSLDFMAGYAGLISLGQAGFLGVGAYGVAIAENHFFSPWAAVGIALGAVLALGLALGIVAVRTKGVSFVIITLALGQVLYGLAYQWTGLSEGDNGITLANLPSAGPFDLNDPLTLRMTVLVVFAVTALLLLLFVHSPFGLSLRGVRSNEARLAALGYRTGLHRYLAWVIAVFFAGVARRPVHLRERPDQPDDDGLQRGRVPGRDGRARRSGQHLGPGARRGGDRPVSAGAEHVRDPMADPDGTHADRGRAGEPRRILGPGAGRRLRRDALIARLRAEQPGRPGPADGPGPAPEGPPLAFEAAQPGTEPPQAP